MVRKDVQLFTLLLASFASLILSLAVAIAPVYADVSCDMEKDLQGKVFQNHATVTNYATNSDCTYDATLAVYDSPLAPNTYGWIEAQTLIGSKSVTVPAGQTVEITVDGTGASCWNQSDVIRGKDVWTPPFYWDAMATDVYQVNSCEQQPTSTPTPTPTPTVTATPTPTTVQSTPTPTVTPTPVPANTPTPTPGSGSVLGLASTGNSVMVYTLLAAGAVFLILGMILKKINK